MDANYHKGISNIEHAQRTHVKAVLTPDRAEKRQNGRRFKEDGEPMFTLTGQDRHGVAIGVKQIGNCMANGKRENPNQGRVYDTEGLAPTLSKMEGGVDSR